MAGIRASRDRGDRPRGGKQHRQVMRKELFLHFPQELSLLCGCICPTLAVPGPLGAWGWFLIVASVGLGMCVTRDLK